MSIERISSVWLVGTVLPGAIFLASLLFLLHQRGILSDALVPTTDGAGLASLSMLYLLSSFVVGTFMRLVPPGVLGCSRCLKTCARDPRRPGSAWCYLIGLRNVFEKMSPAFAAHDDVADLAGGRGGAGLINVMKLTVAASSPTLWQQILAAEALLRFVSGSYWAGLASLALLPLHLGPTGPGHLVVLYLMPLLAATAVASAAFSFWHDGKYGGASRMRWGIAASTTVALAASMVLLALRGFLDADDRGAVLSWLAFVHAFQAFACWFFLPRAIRREALFVCAAYGLVRHSNSAVTPSASAPTSPLQA